jgi:methyl-accepting chemotaxis protein
MSELGVQVDASAKTSAEVRDAARQLGEMAQALGQELGKFRVE